jgi:addiction module RelB/DinJ family antitoxin
MSIFILHFYYFVWQMATISVRVDDKLKEQTYQLADELGISFSTLVTVWMKKFVREKKIEIGVDDTHREWYADKHMVEVNAPANDVFTYLQTLQK